MKNLCCSLLTVLGLGLLAGCASDVPRYAANDLLLKRYEAEARQPASDLKGNAGMFRDSLALPDLLKLTAEINPGLRNTFYRWKAELAQISVAKSLPDPRLTFAAFIQPVETRVGPQEQRFGLAQTIPWPGTLGLRGQLASESAQQIYHQLEWEKRRLFYQVKSAYYDYALLQRTAAILGTNIDLLDYLENVVRTKYTAGTATFSNLIKIEVERDRLHNQLASVRDGATPLLAMINGMISRPANSPLLLKVALPKDTVFFDEASFENRLLKHHPAFKIDSLQQQQKATALQLARKAFYPDVTIGVDYIRTGEALNPDMTDSGKDPIAAMISLNLPLWWGKKQAGETAAQASLLAAEKQMENRQIDLRTELARVLFRYRDAKRQLLLYANTLLPRAEQAFAVARTAYQAGNIDILNLIDAQRTLLEFQLAIEKAAADYHQRLAELELLTAPAANPEE